MDNNDDFEMEIPHSDEFDSLLPHNADNDNVAVTISNICNRMKKSMNRMQQNEISAILLELDTMLNKYFYYAQFRSAAISSDLKKTVSKTNKYLSPRGLNAENKKTMTIVRDKMNFISSIEKNNNNYGCMIVFMFIMLLWLCVGISLLVFNIILEYNSR
jgi:hypothetical protein